ncbi:Protein REVEILLE like [Heracleum sosnowskyi]|uniref:Protein REVEILLE like n=1 Tax=Heracleum sosnowskyi TaxID=360622 RepID=A0AAD8MBX3_9APIA|nr:Protein REVEILLE like [Heracleum sosnowskyi]
MVSLNSKPPENFYLDPEMGMGLPNIGAFSTQSGGSNPGLSDDLSKKIRKPYTITKSRESWTDPEHDKFLEALHLFDRDWKKIEAFIGSKTVIQIRSHAQKYFMKVQKSGTNEHLPPPRPKRKASHPYPQKASKNAPVPSQAKSALQTTSSQPETGFIRRPDSSPLLRNPAAGTTPVSSQTESSMQTVGFSDVTKGDILSARQQSNCCSSTESTPRTQPTCEINDQRNHGSSLRVLPDFAEVYSFIGSVFDPNTKGHVQKLKEMDPIDVETVLLLMRNLSINLTSPKFEDHRKLLSSYQIDVEKENTDDMVNNLLDDQADHSAQFG